MSLFQDIQKQILSSAGDFVPLGADDAVVIANTREILICKDSNGDWLYELKHTDPPVRLKVSADYEHIQMSQDEAGVAAGADRSRFLLRTAFECRFAHQGIVSLHGACVQKDGRAFVFTGHSGAGKSTRAFAWADENGLAAELISGDRPAVRLELASGANAASTTNAADPAATACGVPWDGKEQIFCDAEAPLACIMDVRRSPANYLRRLTKRQAQALLTQQAFIPMWDTDSAALALANVRRLAAAVPVYRVYCGMTPDDARVIYDVVTNHPELIKPAQEEEELMQIKNGFVLRNVLDEHMVMPAGDLIGKFDGTVVLNDVSAFVFEQLKEPVSREDILAAILAEYEVDEETAAKDLDALLAQFRELGMLDE